ncbi:TPA: helix-turn-helix domain-containing protein [Klebsiella pneumoniae]|uniref:helix-turn-helix domain-containing protein n=1 Tax=Klebsiella pneumoniae TaxID=573 RepID=UPI00124B4CE6|nr:helix-turn-helix domain-containing protein [Klebsiella pneumoniae]HBQ5841237.1 helix-turn-helix domain-containing protein [Klebsiella pneumoniae subsp. pneumoniae]KAB1809306.1 helix-turn-helix domain-containing protein [Klebsiella pneumoniae]HBQ5846319.1 helix-turn-helix domain-containing protein [Klebsiella pneumoniae subsp. pneumoniae]HBQ6030837.1 helix-turn-helix domain-containing protein [Klebsiella pneumoniae subsp. pneumoniae]HBS9983337.1 helix-turn-helix domain-containing protein [Kl
MSLMAKAMGVKVGNSLRKLVLIKLADNANDKGECWPSYQHIADQCECSKSAVRNHIDALEDMGLIKRENRVGVNNGKGNTSNVYYLNLDVTPMPPKSTGVCHEIAPPMPSDGTPPMPPDGTRTSHSFEPVTEPDSLSARGKFISEAAKRRIGISSNGEIPFPPAFKPSADHIAIASEKGINIETELLNFRDYHQARGTKLIDWNSAFRVWLRNARVNPLSGRQRSEPDSPHWNSPEGWKDFI